METKFFMLTEDEVAVLRAIAKQLYSEERLTADDMRNLAQKIDGVLSAAIPVER